MSFGKLCLLLIIPLVVARSAWAQIAYSKTAEIPPLRVSIVQLQGVLDKVTTLADAANRGQKPLREELIYKSKEVQVKRAGRILQPAGAKGPDQIDTLTYTYWAPDASSVSRLSFDFSDFRRVVTVEGTSPEQVDALFAVLRDDLMKLSHPVGGTPFKALASLPWVVFLVIIGWFAPDLFSKRNPRSLLPLAGSALGLIILTLLPTEELFAGFRAIQGDPSFLVRYGPEISFLGFVLAAVVFPFSLPFLRKSRKAPPASSTAVDDSVHKSPDQ